MSEWEDGDDIPQLSADTFNALQEFYREQEERENKMKYSELSAESCIDGVQLDENWQLSQFWYDEETIETLVNVTLKAVGPQSKIALLSCPTLYKKMKEKSGGAHEITLFEYDKRFAMYGQDFVLYDYKAPLDVPRNKASYYDIVLADPPFLSDECLTKTAVTIKFLSKGKIILCTGAIMEDLSQRLLDLRKSSFQPKHKNNLANEFSCYSNFNLDDLL